MYAGKPVTIELTSEEAALLAGFIGNIPGTTATTDLWFAMTKYAANNYETDPMYLAGKKEASHFTYNPRASNA